MSGHMLLINPRERKAKTKTRAAAPKRRKTAARRTRRRALNTVAGYYPNPAPHRRRSRLSALRTKVKRIGRKYRRNPAPRLSLSGITSMAKSAAIGATGALAVDVAFGYAKTVLPASMQSPIAADGSMNTLYFAAKAALAIGVGVLGRKLTKHAPELAAGSLTVQAYEVMRSLVPASVNLGNVPSPARVVGRPRIDGSGRVISMSQYVSGMSGYTPPVAKQYMGEFVS